MRFHLFAAAAALTTLVSQADAQVIGDKDCFGTLFGSQSATSCNGQTYAIPSVPSDGRSAAEQFATNGAEQTDFYSSNFNPLASSFTMVWNLSGPLVTGSLDYRAYGLQANQFSPFTTSLNGFSFLGLVEYQDGATQVATHGYALTSAQVTQANMDGFLSLTIDRGNSNDAVAFDYIEFSGQVVPEPASVALMAVGLAGLGIVARRRRRV